MFIIEEYIILMVALAVAAVFSGESFFDTIMTLWEHRSEIAQSLFKKT